LTMDQSNYAILILSQFFPTIPSLLVYIAGVVLASVFMSRYKLPCIFMLSAFLLLFFSSVAQTLVYSFLITRMRDLPISHYGLLVSGSALLGSFAHAIAVGLLIAAALVRRGLKRENTGNAETPGSAL
jgi:hypothetical protein